MVFCMLLKMSYELIISVHNIHDALYSTKCGERYNVHWLNVGAFNMSGEEPTDEITWHWAWPEKIQRIEL